jgi:hypothetical protein
MIQWPLMRRISTLAKGELAVTALLFFYASLHTELAYAESAPKGSPDWSEEAPVPIEGNANRYGLPPEDYNQSVRAGKLHAQVYPVEITGILPPYQPFATAMNGDSENPLSKIFHSLVGNIAKLKTVEDALDWLGLHPYPAPTDTGVYSFPIPEESRIPAHRVGFGIISSADGDGFSISCAACHSSRLFGKTVLGMTNRFVKANEVFLLAKAGTHLITPQMLKTFAGANAGEMRLYSRVQKNLKFVGAKQPASLGLDTSLAQVSLSLDRRTADDYAEKDPRMSAHPRPDILTSEVADSKPAVWWNLKYKNRWLSDGSVISGNPIYTNILWNEIGRGTDLHELESWFDKNQDVIRDLTSAVFSTEAPRFTDFFPAERINLASAKRGEVVYNQRCARCHGHYDKVWSLDFAQGIPVVDQLRTWRVRYHDQTPVVDVGTDPGRRLGMAPLERLNDLAISKRIGVVIQKQDGYVPPPLVGIWARWPYFHNNSVPSLCAVLTRHEMRPKKYSAVEAEDPNRDFDSECNGYPRQPLSKVRSVYETSRPGMRNIGHDEGIFLKNGKELLTRENKEDLIRFLQTL